MKWIGRRQSDNMEDQRGVSGVKYIKIENIKNDKN